MKGKSNMILSPRHNPLNLSVNILGRNHENSSLRNRPLSPRPASPLPPSRRPLLSDTPIPSPSLPSILPRHGKKSQPRVRQRMLRFLLWFVGTIVLLYGGLRIAFTDQMPSPINYLPADGKAYEIVGQDELPDFPSALVVTDQRGREKWTVSIPANRQFPLRPSEYRQICMQTQEIAKHVEEAKKGGAEHAHKAHRDYYYHDPYYMDIADAEAHGLLPTDAKEKNTWANLLESDASMQSMIASPSDADNYCSKSMTFVMESEDAGLGATLLGLWLSYGLAQKENRAFFVDDTNWAYGSFKTYFKLPPKPSCRPPPRNQITPCPHQARHLLVSAATTPFIFGGAFAEHFEDARKMEVFRQEPIFDMIRAGYDALFELSDINGDATFLASRIDSLNSTIRGKGGIEIGIHVRHGDRHPMEFQYQNSYLPLEKYANAAREILYSSFDDPVTGKEDMMGEMASKFVLATDDPDVYTSTELSHAWRAQERISLASKSQETKTSTVSGVDNRVGWEGGFFRDVFWSLGLDAAARSLPDDSPRPSYRRSTDSSKSLNTVSSSSSSEPAIDSQTLHQIHPSSAALHLRELIARAYLLDLAVLGQSDHIVCGVSSMGCRILAVMMGWENSFEKGKWKNVDGEFDWWGLSW